MGFILRQTGPGDIYRVALCYRKAFSKSLASAFGTSYVVQTLQWFLSTNQNFLFHLEEEEQNEVIGFCGGMINDGIHPRGSASEMIQFAFLEGIRSMIKRPWLIFHNEMRSKYGLAFKNLRKKILKPPMKNYTPGTVEPFCGLVVIGVNPDFQNQGIGNKLLQEFEVKAKASGLLKMKLSVKIDNSQAIRSYEKNGWKKGEQRGPSISMYKILELR